MDDGRGAGLNARLFSIIYYEHNHRVFSSEDIDVYSTINTKYINSDIRR